MIQSSFTASLMNSDHLISMKCVHIGPFVSQCKFEHYAAFTVGPFSGNKHYCMSHYHVMGSLNVILEMTPL